MIQVNRKEHRTNSVLLSTLLILLYYNNMCKVERSILLVLCSFLCYMCFAIPS